MLPVRLQALFFAAAAGSCLAESYTVHHRLGTSKAWQKRGEIQTEASSSAPDSKQSAFLSPAATYRDLTGDPYPWNTLQGYESWSEEPYQVALTSLDGVVDDATPFTFVRACQLSTDSDEVITLHKDVSGKTVVGINYDLAGLNAATLGTRGCPTQNLATKPKQVLVRLSKQQDPLTLPTPAAPVVKPDGTPLKPGEKAPEEPSFVRKYWYIIVPVVLLMLVPTELADSNNEEGENGGGGDTAFSSGVSKGRVGAGSNARKR